MKIVYTISLMPTQADWIWFSEVETFFRHLGIHLSIENVQLFGHFSSREYRTFGVVKVECKRNDAAHSCFDCPLCLDGN